jgi:hypothetical protein
MGESTSILIPNGLALHATGSNIPYSGIFDGSSTFSIGGWFKINEYVDRYLTLAALYKSSNPGENNSYMWFGVDRDAGEGQGTRGWSYYLPNGGHAVTTVVNVGNWYHWCLTKNANIWTGYTNGIPQYWDDGSGNPYIDWGGSYDEIDTITFWTEDAFGTSSCAGSMCANFICTKALSQAEIQTIMYQRIPGVGIPSFGALGVFPLTGATDLSSTTGSPTLVQFNSGTLGTTRGPIELDTTDASGNANAMARGMLDFFL